MIDLVVLMAFPRDLSQIAREDKRRGVSFASEFRKLTGRSRSLTVNTHMNGSAAQESTHSKEEKAVCPSMPEASEWRERSAECVCSAWSSHEVLDP